MYLLEQFLHSIMNILATNHLFNCIYIYRLTVSSKSSLYNLNNLLYIPEAKHHSERINI